MRITVSLCRASLTSGHPVVAGSVFSQIRFAMEDKVPRGLRTLRNIPKPESTDTLAQLKTEASTVEQWWAQPRWKYTKRIYAGELCFGLRSNVVLTIIACSHGRGQSSSLH